MSYFSLLQVQQLALQHTATHCNNTFQQAAALVTRRNQTFKYLCVLCAYHFRRTQILVLLQCVVAVCCSESRCTRKNEEHDAQVFVCALCATFKKYLNVLFLVLTSAAAHTAAHCNNTLQQHKYLCVPKIIRTNHIQILEYLIPRYHE